MKSKLVSPLAIAIAALCSTAPAWSADLLAVYRDALAQDPVFASARAAYAVAQEGLPQAKAGVLPSASLSANVTPINYEQSLNNLTSKRDYTQKGYTLSLSQPLFRMQNWLVVDQAGLQVKQAEAVFADAKQSLITRTAQAYFDVLLAQDNVALSSAQKTAFSEQLAQAKRNFEVGTATIVDTYEAQARYDLAVAKEIADQNDLAIKKSALQQLIGKPAPAVSPLKDAPEMALPTPADPEQWIKGAEEASPTVAQARLAMEIAKKEIDRNKAGHYPTVDLVGSHAYTDSPSSGVPFNSRTTAIGIQVNVPLFSGGATQSRIKQALSAKDRAEQDLENARRVVGQSVRNFFVGVTSGAAQVKALEASLVSSKSSLDSTVLGKDVGVRTNVDVLNAQQQLFQTRRDLQQARYNTILAQLRLKAAAGRLVEEDLAEVNRLLQP